MLDYIFIDYLAYVIPYSVLISIGVFIAVMLFKPFNTNKKVVLSSLIFIALTFLINFVYVHLKPDGSYPHYRCNEKLEAEAQNFEMALLDYFSIPDRKEIPSFTDLVNSGHFSRIYNKDLKRRDKLIRESEFSVKILGDVNEILIVISCKKGKCPFYRWKCSRPYKGKFYVRRMGGSEVDEWLDSLEEI